MLKKRFKITDKYGIHARPATTLVNICMKYECDIMLSNFKKSVDMKSILEVMALGIKYNNVIEISCDGINEDLVLEEISNKIIELNLGRII